MDVLETKCKANVFRGGWVVVGNLGGKMGCWKGLGLVMLLVMVWGWFFVGDGVAATAASILCLQDKDAILYGFL